VKSVVSSSDCVLDPSKMIEFTENIKILIEHQPIENPHPQWEMVPGQFYSLNASSFSGRLSMIELITSMETHPELTGLEETIFLASREIAKSWFAKCSEVVNVTMWKKMKNSSDS
jgi:hypothetical protein